jgi:hypothetical protein
MGLSPFRSPFSDSFYARARTTQKANQECRSILRARLRTAPLRHSSHGRHYNMSRRVGNRRCRRSIDSSKDRKSLHNSRPRSHC